MISSAALYLVKDKVSGQTGEIMHASNDAAIKRTFDRLFSADKHNFLIRDLEVFRFADLKFFERDPFPVVETLKNPVCILSGADYFEEIKESDSE